MALSLRILVVAESVAFGGAVARVLESSGYLVDLADTIELARRLDESTIYVAAFADVELPGGGAVELARTSYAPVIAMADHPDWRPPSDTRVRAVVLKPFGRIVLEAALAAARRA